METDKRSLLKLNHLKVTAARQKLTSFNAKRSGLGKDMNLFHPIKDIFGDYLCKNFRTVPGSILGTILYKVSGQFHGQFQDSYKDNFRDNFDNSFRDNSGDNFG